MKLIPFLFAFTCTAASAQFVMPPIAPTPGQTPMAIQTQGAIVQSQLAGQMALAQSLMARAQIASYMGLAASQTADALAMANMASSMRATSNQFYLQSAMHSAAQQNMMLSRQHSLAALTSAAAVRSATLIALQTAAEQPGQSAAPSVLVPPMPPMNYRPTSGLLLKIDKPSFSVEGGKVAAGTKVKVKTDTHYSTVYYTTDGWTPTTSSPHYTAPIEVNESMHLQTMAIGPNMMRSPVNHIDYTVEKPIGHSAAEPIVLTDGVLHAGTRLRLHTAGPDVSSASAAVGDKLPLELDQDVKVGDTIVIPKGTKVDAVLTNADPVSSGGPGDLVFEVRSITVAGKTITLLGGETLEGTEAMLSKKEAIIKPGMTLTAIAAEDASLKP